jgi:hypothetical protein
MSRSSPVVEPTLEGRAAIAPALVRVMEPPQTRTFVEGGGRERVLEITWHGGEVEVVLGPRGKPGRVTEKVFASVEARDAYIAARIAKAEKEVFVERVGDAIEELANEAPIVDPETLRLAALRERHLGTTYRPTLEPGDDAVDASKYGGTPWLSPGDEWPLCRSCSLPMTFVLQLRREEVPESLRSVFEGDLIQIFACTLVGKPGEPEWICRPDGSASATAPSVFLRHARMGSIRLSVADALDTTDLAAWRRTQYEGLIAHCRRVGDSSTAAKIEAQLLALAPIDARDLRVPESLSDALTHKLLLAPSFRVSGWRAEEEVPSYEDPLSLDDVDDLEEHFDLRCLHGHKLGGHPAWHQGPPPRGVRCGCGEPMAFFLQIASSTPVVVAFGGDGTAYVHHCHACRALSLVWQR